MLAWVNGPDVRARIESVIIGSVMSELSQVSDLWLLNCTTRAPAGSSRSTASPLI